MAITQKELHENFRYEETTGKFYWKVKPQRFAGGHDCEAGSFTEHHGFRRCSLWLKGRRIYRSRAAYIYVHGDIKSSVLIDHVNGDTTDDRIENLRPAGHAQNAWNRVGTTGLPKGVSKGNRGKYKSRITAPGRKTKINLGTWDTPEEAHAAYMGAAAVLHGEFWLGNRPSAG